MKPKTKIAITECLIITLSWIGIYYFYYVIAFWGTSFFFVDGGIKSYLNEWYVHVEMIAGSILFGLMFCFIDFTTDRTSIRRKSFGSIIVIKSCLYLIMVLFVFGIIYGLFYLFKVGPFETPEVLLEIINLKFIISWFLYFIFSILLVTFVIQVNRKFGPGNLLKMVSGRYHKPQDEVRIFLFLDLKNSTAIAEKLGHNKYSQFIQNCYHDLTEIVIKYRADIYQYVGDEVVFSWNCNNNSNSLNGIEMYFDYKKKLAGKREFYLNNFGIHPEFKGGMDYGIVTIAEVGDIKREMAFHGDVLNTASRIQSKCKEYGEDLLISENLEKYLQKLDGFRKDLVGEVTLRGKQSIIKIFSIQHI